MADTQTTQKPRRGLTLTKADHKLIQDKCNLSGTEDYGVVTHRGKGEVLRSVHVFQRGPTTKEVNNYEQTASRLKFRGNRAEQEGSQIKAAVELYNTLIERVYELPVGLKRYPTLDREQAMETVPALVKREAIRDTISEVYSASRLAEAEGEDEQVAGQEDD